MYAPMQRAGHNPGPGGPGGPSQMELDEALARQLQRAEMDGISTPLILGGNSGGSGNLGGGGGYGQQGSGLGAGAGGGRDGSMDEARQTRLNALQNVREVRSASFALCIVLLVNIPQIIAAVVILAKYWNDQTCGPRETLQWRTYALIAATRMFFYVSTVTALYHLNGRLNMQSGIMRFLSHARNGLDAFGLIWFVVGNMWLFGGDVEICPHPNRSPLYTLCVAMVLINYAQLCLPCVVVIVMLPVLCFCLPCLIRILARIQDPMRGKGATPSMINKLPSMKYRQMQARNEAAAAQQQQAANGQNPQAAAGAAGAGAAGAAAGAAGGPTSVTGVESNSTSCAICISEYALDEDIRLLPCSHYFHTSCVDEWLRVNASCPTCRASILPDHPDHPTPSRYGTTNSPGSTSGSGSGSGAAGGTPRHGGSPGGLPSSSSVSAAAVPAGAAGAAAGGRPATGDHLV